MDAIDKVTFPVDALAVEAPTKYTSTDSSCKTIDTIASAIRILIGAAYSYTIDRATNHPIPSSRIKAFDS
jgi:hypothetical protein